MGLRGYHGAALLFVHLSPVADLHEQHDVRVLAAPQSEFVP